MVNQTAVRPKTLISLDFMRGIAALGIVLYHLTNEAFTRLNYRLLGGFFLTGYSGVYVFFVLSGFILYYLYGSKLGKRSEIKIFLLKRIVRLYPLYLISTLAIGIGLFLFRTHAATTFSFTLPFVFNTVTLLPHDFRIIPPSWALTYEIYFYLLFSLLFFVKSGKKFLIAGVFYSLIIIITAWWVTPFVPGLRVGHSASTVQQVVLGVYVIEFFMGIAAAYFLKNPIVYGNRNTIFVTGISLFIISSIVNSNLRISGTILEELRFLYFGVPAALIMYGCAAIELSLKRSLPGVLAFPGKISYAVYLTHYAVIQLMISRLGTFANKYPSDLLFFGISSATFCIAMVVGIIFYFGIEKNVDVLLRKKIRT